MRKVGCAIGVLGALFLIPVVLWFGYTFYVEFIVGRSPGTISVIKTSAGEQRLGSYVGGHQVVPGSAQPTPGTAAGETGGEAAAADGRPPLPTADASAPVLPPTRLLIPRIGVDVPIVLADNDNLPKFRGVGWYIGTGYPGFRGNVVLFGHVDGKYETLGRLNEIEPGDQVDVVALDRIYRYVVISSQVVPRNAVEVMAPTTDSRVTLITCAGIFIPNTRDYTDRLVVTASLVQ